MSTPLNLGFTRQANCSLHDAVLTAHQEGLDARGYVRHVWRCEFGCAIPLTDAEAQRWGWQFFNKTSQLLGEQRERLYSPDDIIKMLTEECGLEMVEEESVDGRITLRKRRLQ